MSATTPLDKIESACKMVNQINRGFMRTRAESLSILSLGKVTDPAGEVERLPIDDLKTIVELYMPTLLENWRSLVANRDALGKLYTDLVIATAIDKTATKPTAMQINAAFERADKACDAFLSIAYTIARER